MRTRIKICGITRPEDGLAAARAGADAVGLVFAAGSPRAVSFENARAVTAVLPPFVTVVGLFVDAAPERVRETIGAVRLDLLQFHGAETPEYCRQFSSPYIKAIPMRSDIDLYGQERLYGDAAGLLLDTYVSGVAGGTGESFDWGRIPRDLSKPVILAGGLSPANVGEAVRRARPYAVDVSSGVEQAKGIKDASRILAFVNAVRSVE